MGSGLGIVTASIEWNPAIHVGSEAPVMMVGLPTGSIHVVEMP